MIRLDGTNADEGRAILAPNLNDKLMMEDTMLERGREGRGAGELRKRSERAQNHEHLR